MGVTINYLLLIVNCQRLFFINIVINNLIRTTPTKKKCGKKKKQKKWKNSEGKKIIKKVKKKIIKKVKKDCVKKIGAKKSGKKNKIVELKVRFVNSCCLLFIIIINIINLIKKYCL